MYNCSNAIIHSILTNLQKRSERLFAVIKFKFQHWYMGIYFYSRAKDYFT